MNRQQKPDLPAGPINGHSFAGFGPSDDSSFDDSSDQDGDRDEAPSEPEEETATSAGAEDGPYIVQPALWQDSVAETGLFSVLFSQRGETFTSVKDIPVLSLSSEPQVVRSVLARPAWSAEGVLLFELAGVLSVLVGTRARVVLDDRLGAQSDPIFTNAATLAGLPKVFFSDLAAEAQARKRDAQSEADRASQTASLSRLPMGRKRQLPSSRATANEDNSQALSSAGLQGEDDDFGDLEQ